MLERSNFVRVPFSSDVIPKTRNSRIKGRIENMKCPLSKKLIHTRVPG